MIRNTYLSAYYKAMREYEEKCRPHLDKIARLFDNWCALLEEALVCNQWMMKYENETTEEDL